MAEKIDRLRQRHLTTGQADERSISRILSILPKPRPVFHHTGVLGVVAAFRGQGIGSTLIAATLEAAKGRDVTRIELHVREQTLRAIALCEKSGLVREGLLRKDVYVDGAYENSVMMAVLFRDEG